MNAIAENGGRCSNVLVNQSLAKSLPQCYIFTANEFLRQQVDRGEATGSKTLFFGA